MWKIINLKFWTVCVFCFIVTPGFCAEQKTQGKFDIFTDGRKFGSIEEYKQYRINTMRAEVLQANQKVGQAALPDLDDESREKYVLLEKPSKMTAADFDSSQIKTMTFVFKNDYSPDPFIQKSLPDRLGEYLNKMLKHYREQEKTIIGRNSPGVTSLEKFPKP